jgi:DNA polymerase-3 subunit alpha
MRVILAARETLDVPPTLFNLCQHIDGQEVTRLTWEALIKAGCFDFTGHDRGAILASLDLAMADGARAASDRKAGQASLFGGAPEPTEADAAATECIDPSKAFDRQQALRAEYEVLGFYLSGHPLEERAGLFRMLSTTTSVEIGARGAGTQIVLAGLILGKSETVVKKGRSAGQKMARFQLEDLEGSVSVTVFPRTYEQYRDRIEDGAVVVCVGKADESDEPAMLLDEVLDIEEAISRFEGGLMIRVDPDDEGQLPELRAILGRHKGGRPLFLQVRGRDGRSRRVRAGKDAGVAISAELATEVDRLLGVGRVSLARV